MEPTSRQDAAFPAPGHMTDFGIPLRIATHATRAAVHQLVLCISSAAQRGFPSTLEEIQSQCRPPPEVEAASFFLSAPGEHERGSDTQGGSWCGRSRQDRDYAPGTQPAHLSGDELAKMVRCGGGGNRRPGHLGRWRRSLLRKLSVTKRQGDRNDAQPGP